MAQTPPSLRSSSPPGDATPARPDGPSAAEQSQENSHKPPSPAGPPTPSALVAVQSAQATTARSESAPHLFRSTQPTAPAAVTTTHSRDTIQGIPQHAAQAILARFLSLDDPQITAKLVDYLQLEGTMELYLNFIVQYPASRRFPSVVPGQRGYRFPHLLAMFPHRERACTDREVMKRSYAATHALAAGNNMNSNAIAMHKLDIVLCALFAIFEPSAQGNFYHFRKLTKFYLDTYAERTLQCLLTVNPAATSIMDSPVFPDDEYEDDDSTSDSTSSGCSGSGSDGGSPHNNSNGHPLNQLPPPPSPNHPLAQLARGETPAGFHGATLRAFANQFLEQSRRLPLLFGALPYLYAPPVMDFVTHVVVRRSTPNVYRERFDHLRDERFTDFLFLMLDHRWEPHVYRGAADFLITLLDGHYNLPRLDLLFLNWELYQDTPLSYTDLLVENIAHDPESPLTDCCVETLAVLLRKTACLYGRWIRQRQHVRHVEPQFGPTNSLIALGQFVRRALQPHLPRLCEVVSARYAPTPLSRAAATAHPSDSSPPSESATSRRLPLDFKYLQLIEIVYQVLVEAEDLEPVLRSVDNVFWIRLVDLYFTHTSNSLLQSLVYKLITLLVHHAQYPLGCAPESSVSPAATSDVEDANEEMPAAGVSRSGTSPVRIRPAGGNRQGPHRRRHQHPHSAGMVSTGSVGSPVALPASLGRMASLASALAGYHLGASPSSDPVSSAPRFGSTPGTPPPTFGAENDVLVYLVTTGRLVERLVGVCRDDLPSNPLRGTSLLILNTLRLGIDAVDVDLSQAYQSHSSEPSESVSFASSYDSLAHGSLNESHSMPLAGAASSAASGLTGALAGRRFLPLPEEEGPADFVPTGAGSGITAAAKPTAKANLPTPVNSPPTVDAPTHNPTRGDPSSLADQLHALDLHGDVDLPGDFVPSTLTGGPGWSSSLPNGAPPAGARTRRHSTAGFVPLVGLYGQHWTQRVRDQPTWHNFLPELRRRTYVQIEPWSSFRLVNYNREPFACQPPLPYFSPLNIRMPEEYANNYLNRRTLPNTQEGLLGTRASQNPAEPIRGVTLDEKGIDVGSLYAYSLGFGITPGDPADGKDDGTGKPNSRTIRKRGPSSRRKRIKSAGAVRSQKPGIPTGATAAPVLDEAGDPTPRPPLPSSPTLAVRSTNGDSSQRDGPLGAATPLNGDAFPAPSPPPLAQAPSPTFGYESDTLNEVQREQAIKQAFFRQAGIPDQSKVPLYPPVLVRPRSTSLPQDAEPGNKESEEGKGDEGGRTSASPGGDRSVKLERPRSRRHPSDHRTKAATSSKATPTAGSINSPGMAAARRLPALKLQAAAKAPATTDTARSPDCELVGEYVMVSQHASPSAHSPQRSSKPTVAASPDRPKLHRSPSSASATSSVTLATATSPSPSTPTNTTDKGALSNGHSDTLDGVNGDPFEELELPSPD